MQTVCLAAQTMSMGVCEIKAELGDLQMPCKGKSFRIVEDGSALKRQNSADMDHKPDLAID